MNRHEVLPDTSNTSTMPKRASNLVPAGLRVKKCTAGRRPLEESSSAYYSLDHLATGLLKLRQSHETASAVGFRHFQAEGLPCDEEEDNDRAVACVRGKAVAAHTCRHLLPVALLRAEADVPMPALGSILQQ